MTTPPGWNQAQPQYPPPAPQPAGQPQYPPSGHQPYPGQYPGQPPYPPPGQPPYGGQPQFPSPPPSGGNRRGRIALVTVSLVVVAALGTVLYLVLGGDDNGSTRAGGDSGASGSSDSSVVAPTTPKGAAKAWLEAVKSGDLDAVKENSCESFAAEIAANPPSKPDAFTYHIRGVTQRNGTTEVAVTERIARDGHVTDSDQVLEIVEEDGRLKVCGESTPLPEGG